MRTKVLREPGARTLFLTVAGRRYMLGVYRGPWQAPRNALSFDRMGGTYAVSVGVKTWASATFATWQEPS